ncbi:GNAT family N-acetyltransferase [Tateyamaria omphalii]|uniref:GNAT family N-acetyltransferase n=1 Tax=Tateyamaria omphalii TaxID=299262 RepID=A0A1P8N166_9RHOB|nr:GNAT family N-acetyltransferase [Tateyamaria omphalii]APX14067.1 GNAT family N-acetyltransferase [Tateyamaria omphalii]
MTQKGVERIEGVRLALRLARPEDAGYIHGLRMDPAYNQHLSAVTGTVEDQANWLHRYLDREAAGEEFYYVIERRDTAQPCGLVRLYDIEADHFTWGSWILDSTKPSKAALESAVLSYVIAFERLGLATSNFDARIGNARALAFYRRLGAVETGRDAQDIFFRYTRAQFERDKDRHMGVLRNAQTAQ